MRFTSSGAVQALDVAPVRALLPAVYDEWRAMRFDAEGCAVNPLTGAADEDVRLVDGVHRHPGAVYAFSEAMSRAGAKQPGGVTLVRLRDEHRGSSDLSITSFDESFWRAEVAVHHHAGKRLPRVVGEVRIDLAEMMQESSKEPLGCGVAWLVGGRGRVSFDVDASALDGSGGRPVDVSGRLNRFQFSVVVDIDRHGATWQVDVRLTLRARGVARPLLWFGGRKLRQGVDAWFTKAWTEVAKNIVRGQAELRKLADATALAGGPQAFVRQELWSDDPDVS